MTAPIRAAIVGLSWIGADPAGEASDPVLGTAVPYSHASALSAAAGVELVAGCDIVPAARDAFEERWRSRWPELRTYGDTREMLEAERIDLLSIVTPDHLHTQPVMDALAAGVPMLFCEKPLATSLTEADAILDALAGSSSTMSVNFTRHWRPEHVEARRLVRDGAIGSLSQVIVQLGGPRAMLFRNHAHTLDLLSYFAEADPTWVTAELEPGSDDYGTTYRGDGGRDPNLEPGVNAYVAFENGVRGYLAGMKSGLPGEVLQLIGDRGRILIDGQGARLLRPGDDGLWSRSIEPRWTVAGMQAAVIDLIAAHAEGRATASPPEHARRTVALTEAILASHAAGNTRVAVSTRPT